MECFLQIIKGKNVPVIPDSKQHGRKKNYKESEKEMREKGFKKLPYVEWQDLTRIMGLYSMSHTI